MATGPSCGRWQMSVCAVGGGGRRMGADGGHSGRWRRGGRERGVNDLPDREGI